MVDVSSAIRVEPTATVGIVAGILATPAVNNNNNINYMFRNYLIFKKICFMLVSYCSLKHSNFTMSSKYFM